MSNIPLDPGDKAVTREIKFLPWSNIQSYGKDKT